MAGATFFTGSEAHGLKKTLQSIVTDKLDGMEADAIMPKYYEQDDMPDNYMDDLEIAGPGIISEKTEGAEMSTFSISEGYLYRYISRTYAGKLICTEEAVEDAKYPQIIQAGVRLKRAAWKTVDISAALILVRATNSNYVFGDGVSLANATHPLAQGGSFSNTLATPMSPSRAAFIVAQTQAGTLPDHDGVVEGWVIKKIVCPYAQWATWRGVTKSEKAPEPGAFNEINVAYEADLEVIPNKYWSNTTTNWAALTDADDGFKFLWRRKMRSRTWVDNDQELLKYGISMRMTYGNSNPRSLIFSNS